MHVIENMPVAAQLSTLKVEVLDLSHCPLVGRVPGRITAKYMGEHWEESNSTGHFRLPALKVHALTSAALRRGWLSTLHELLGERGLWCHSSRLGCTLVSARTRSECSTQSRASGHEIGRRHQHAGRFLERFRGLAGHVKAFISPQSSWSVSHGVHTILLMQMDAAVHTARRLIGVRLRGLPCRTGSLDGSHLVKLPAVSRALRLRRSLAGDHHDRTAGGDLGAHRTPPDQVPGGGPAPSAGSACAP